MGRLRPGVSIGQAQAALAGQFHQFVDSTASTAKEKADLPVLWLQEGAGGLDSLRRRYSKPLYVLMAMVGLILIIACANIANLLLARSTARRREMAVRLSLGAGRMRVVRQLLTESALLSLAGGILGVFVALWGIRSITWLLANGRDNFTLHANLNWPVLGFTLALALVTGLVFGLAPAIQATKLDLTPALKETRAGAQRDPGRRIGFGISLSQVLVASQIAISLLLVVAAGLFGRTLSNLQSVELGFNKENVLLFGLNARQAGYKNAALAQFYADLLNDFRRLPGVRSAGLSQFPLVDWFLEQHACHDSRRGAHGGPKAGDLLCSRGRRIPGDHADPDSVGQGPGAARHVIPQGRGGDGAIRQEVFRRRESDRAADRTWRFEASRPI